MSLILLGALTAVAAKNAPGSDFYLLGTDVLGEGPPPPEPVKKSKTMFSKFAKQHFALSVVAGLTTALIVLTAKHTHRHLSRK